MSGKSTKSYWPTHKLTLRVCFSAYDIYAIHLTNFASCQSFRSSFTTSNFPKQLHFCDVIDENYKVSTWIPCLTSTNSNSTHVDLLLTNVLFKNPYYLVKLVLVVYKSVLLYHSSQDRTAVVSWSNYWQEVGPNQYDYFLIGVGLLPGSVNVVFIGCM